jgi:hypothetical protein
MGTRQLYSFDIERIFNLKPHMMAVVFANAMLANRMPEKPPTPAHAALGSPDIENEASGAMHRLAVLARMDGALAGALRPLFETAMDTDENPNVRTWARRGYENATERLELDQHCDAA